MTSGKPDRDYRVLARKYRPSDFGELIGQDALVRTLTNAIKAGRIAHAFILTGVRGVGKTTTARIIARALNCLGPDGKGGPTAKPCGQCDACITIAADRNVDVIEIDAASNTGVDNIREIIEAVRYAPVSVRYKVYIIDEVHMLSRAAFNALLKTLEEPPDHAKFIFATTEIRKVPVTVLSRCQRFDLRRIDSARLQEHFSRILDLEGVSIDAEALAIIARAADGSVRDGLSLLDQAISQAMTELGVASVDKAEDPVTVTGEQTRRMLGLADRNRIVDLFEALVTAKGSESLTIAAELYADGADPLVVTQDLLDFTHFLTRWKVVPDLAADTTLTESERTRGAALAESLSMPALTRCWQILLKGLGEVQIAPDPAAALDMVLIRLIHGASLPTPDDLLKRLAAQPSAPLPDPAGAPAASGDTGLPPGRGERPEHAGNRVPTASPPTHGQVTSRAGTDAGGYGATTGSRSVRGSAEPKPDADPDSFAIAESALPAKEAGESSGDDGTIPTSFRELVDHIAEMGEPVMHAMLYSFVHVVRYEPGRLEFRPRDGAPDTLANDLTPLLRTLPGKPWVVSVSREAGEPTLSEQDAQDRRDRLEAAAAHPTVQALFKAFPNTQILDIHATRGSDTPVTKDYGMGPAGTLLADSTQGATVLDDMAASDDEVIQDHGYGDDDDYDFE